MKSFAVTIPSFVRRALLGFCAAALLPALAPGSVLAAPTVLVATGDGNAVLEVDGADDQVVGEIHGVENIHGLAGGGGLILAGSLNPGERGAAPEKPAGMSEDEHAAHHAKGGGDAAEAILSASASAGTVYQIDATQYRVLKKITVPGFVHHTLVTPDGRYGIATHPATGGISVIDMAAGSLVNHIATGPVPNYAVASGDGPLVWVSNAGNDTISEIDTQHWIVRRNLMVGKAPEHMVLSPDGSSLYVVNTGDGTVSRLDVASGETVQRWSVGEDPHGIDLSRDGRQLFVSVKGENKLVAIEPETGVVRTLSLAPEPYHLAVVGERKLYVSSRGQPVIWVVDQRALRVVDEIPIHGIGHQMVVLDDQR